MAKMTGKISMSATKMFVTDRQNNKSRTDQIKLTSPSKSKLTVIIFPVKI